MMIGESRGGGERRVVVFPALAPKVAGKQIYFLFSVTQVADVLGEASIRPVPFSPSFIEGVAEWRGEVLPVISLEEALGLEKVKSNRQRRLLVVQTPIGRVGQTCTTRSIHRVDSAIGMLALPLDCTPALSAGWIPREQLIKGVYEWTEGYLVVVGMERLVNGNGRPAAEGSLCR